MEKVRHVELFDGYSHRDLEEIERSRYKMKEVEGEIIFCESEHFSWGNSLVMKLKGFRETIRWDHEQKMPLPALVGQTLRGFYEKYDGETVELEAYELLDGSKVIRRGKISNKYKFVELN